VWAPTAASSSPVTAVREAVMRPSASTSTALWCEPKWRKVAGRQAERVRRPVDLGLLAAQHVAAAEVRQGSVAAAAS
jgi:hypothetical protein